MLEKIPKHIRTIIISVISAVALYIGSYATFRGFGVIESYSDQGGENMIYKSNVKIISQIMLFA
jgi:hypothetical protein